MKNFTLRRIAAAASLCAAGFSTHAAPSYTCRPLTDEATVPAESNAWASGLNNRNEVVGAGVGSVFGGVSRGSMQWGRDRVGHRLPDDAAGGDFQFRSIASDINDAGQVVGDVYGDGSDPRPVTWKDGQLVELGSLGGGVGRGFATAINKYGVIVGKSIVTMPWGEADRATMWRPNGKIVYLGGLAKKDNSVAFDVNDAGVAVGSLYSSADSEFKAVRWKGGAVQVLSSPRPGGSPGVKAISNHDISVGDTFYVGEGTRATAWRGLEPVDLGTFGWSNDAAAVDINDSGVVVGNSLGAGGNYTPLYWASLEAKAVDLNDLVVGGCTDAFGQTRRLTYVTAINDKGTIVAQAYATDGAERSIFAFRLTPR